MSVGGVKHDTSGFDLKRESEWFTAHVPSFGQNKYESGLRHLLTAFTIVSKTVKNSEKNNIK